jgi:hypothetical protein
VGRFLLGFRQMWFLIACTCAMPAVQVTPSPTDTAPLNARIRVIVPVDPSVSTFELAVAGKKQPKKAKKKKKKKVKKGRIVEVQRSDLRSGALWFVELAPRELLESGTRYELSMVSAGGAPAVIGEITTGQMPDQVPPAWTGVSKTELTKLTASPGSCATGKPFAVFQHKPEKDAAVYAVWVAEDGAAIDYGKPPRAWLRDWAGTLTLGPASICTPSNLELQASGKLRVGFKALDHAGNASAPSEVTLR